MAALSADDKTPEEKLVHWMIVLTWPLWAIGSIYHVFPILAWVLAIWGAARRFGFAEGDPQSIKALPLGVWCWILAMLTMALALILGHLDFGFGPLEILKSLLGWAKGWALFAVLPFAGVSLRIRPHVIIRATNILSAQTLAVIPVFILASMSGLPSVIYISPFYYLGGASTAFFEIGTHWIDPGSPDVRFRFFAPWGPAAALVAQISLVLALFDRDWRWRTVGVVTSLIVCYLAKSRLSIVAIPVILIGIPTLSRLHMPAMIGAAGAMTVGGAFLFGMVQSLVEDGVDRFRSARADSSRVRETLQRIAIQRWWDEAPIFGHGVVERGPHLTEFMPIGSHHTWNGLLFIKGGVGFVAFAAPLAWTFAEMLIRAQRDRAGRVAMGITIVLFINAFGENLEILCYLLWQALLFIGVAMNRRTVGLWTATLGCRR